MPSVRNAALGQGAAEALPSARYPATTATLLLTAGVSPFAVQRIRRHGNPKLTTEVHGHVVPGFLRDAIDNLKLGVPVPFATGLLPDHERGGTRPDDGAGKTPESAGLEWRARLDSNQ